MLGLALAMSLVSLPLVLLGTRVRRISEKGSPERLLGLLFLLLGLVLAPRVLSARALSQDLSSFWLVVSLAAQLTMGVISIALVLFIQRVFRPDAVWARRLRDGLIAALVGTGLVAAAQPVGNHEIAIWSIVTNAVRALPLLWAFAECLRYARMMRQRVALGLGDPVVANRFACWALWTGALGLASLAILPVRLYAFSLHASGQDLKAAAPELYTLVGLIAATTVSVAAVGIWLAFFPPRFWVRRLEASAPQQASTA
jgi:hypothetical protein